MDSLAREELATLMGHAGFPAVSLAMPTHRTVPETLQDPIRFKNLLRAAERRLLAAGVRAPEARRLLDAPRALAEDTAFWTHLADGLALFAAPGVECHWRLPLRLEERVTVGARFRVKPLLPLFAATGTFHVLALSQNAVRLLRGTRWSVDEVELPGVPRSLADALRQESPEAHLQLHTAAPPGRAQGGAIFHGHGGPGEEHKDRLRRYFRQVDAGLAEHLREHPGPLVLAGVEYLLPIYREVSASPRLLPDGVSGNPETLAAEALHRRAWALVQPGLKRAQGQALDRYQALVGTGRTSRDLAEVVPAAHHGRVATLLVAAEAERWGAYDRETGALRLLDGPVAEGEDLLDLAAVLALGTGAEVHVLDATRMPERAPVAAVFRY